MKKLKYFTLVSMLLVAISLSGCRRNSNDVWEDTKSASRHVKRGVRTLGGKHGDSRQIQSRGEFGSPDDDYSTSFAQADDFVPLQDQMSGGDLAMTDSARQPKESPGDPGSSIPGITSFKDPHTISGLANVFNNIHFDYNSDLIKGQDNLSIIRSVGDYLKKNPHTYVFVEGHTDERGAEAYNLALGSRRANSVRNLLVSEGVSPDNIFTISYGKERPLVLDHHEGGWSQNRRAEFKVYVR